MTADFDYGVESSQRGEASIGKAVLLPVSRPLSHNEKEDSDPDIIALKLSADKDKEVKEVSEDGDSNDLEPMVSASSYRGGEPTPTDEQIQKLNQSVEMVFCEASNSSQGSQGNQRSNSAEMLEIYQVSRSLNFDSNINASGSNGSELLEFGTPKGLLEFRRE